MCSLLRVKRDVFVWRYSRVVQGFLTKSAVHNCTRTDHAQVRGLTPIDVSWQRVFGLEMTCKNKAADADTLI